MDRVSHTEQSSTGVRRRNSNKAQALPGHRHGDVQHVGQGTGTGQRRMVQVRHTGRGHKRWAEEGAGANNHASIGMLSMYRSENWFQPLPGFVSSRSSIVELRKNSQRTALGDAHHGRHRRGGRPRPGRGTYVARFGSPRGQLVESKAAARPQLHPGRGQSEVSSRLTVAKSSSGQLLKVTGLAQRGPTQSGAAVPGQTR